MTPMATSLPPSLGWLVWAGRAAVVGPSRANGQHGITAPGDLPVLARRHNMTFWAATLSHDLPLNRSQRAILDVDVHDQGTAALEATRQLLAAVGALTDAGIRSVAIKGPLHALWLYGNLAARRFIDLDIVIDPGAADRAARVLQALGYRLPEYAPADAAGVIFAGRAAYPLRREDAFDIDLHWRLADTKFAQALAAGPLLDRAATLQVGPVAVRTPCPTDCALIALQHAAKHGWCGLEMILGLAFLMVRPDVDWNEVQRAARASGTSRGVLAGVRLARDIFAVPSPPLDGLDSAALEPLLGAAVKALSAPAGVHPDWRAERALHRASLDRRRDRVMYDILRVVMPTPLDAQWRRVPDRAAPLYAPLRLLRLGVRALNVTGRRPIR